MSRSVRIAPSLISADFVRLGEQLRDSESAGADLFHFDVMDGRFVPNITLGPLVLAAVRRATTLPLDVHLMIVEPDHLLGAFAEAGADVLQVHVEACTHLNRTLSAIKQLGCRAGVAINPHTPAVMLSEVMHLVDVINVMTVNPGFSGQKFLPEVLPKIRQIYSMIEDSGRAIDLEVDGGIDTETAKKAVAAGADVLIAGSAIYSDQHTVQAGIAALRAVL